MTALRLLTASAGLILGSTLAAPRLSGQTAEISSYAHPETGLGFDYPQAFSVVDSATLPRLLARVDLSEQNREALVYLSERGLPSNQIQLIDPDHPAGIFLEIVDRSADSLGTERRVDALVRHERDVEGAEVTKEQVRIGPEGVPAWRVVRLSTLTPAREVHVFVELRGRSLVIRYRDDPRLGKLALERALAFQRVLNTLAVPGGDRQGRAVRRSQ